MKKNGFTLIELMILMSIIGILAAIAIPKFASLIHQSNIAQCKNGNETACKNLSDEEYARAQKKEEPAAAAAPAATAAAPAAECDFHNNPVSRGIVKYVHMQEYSDAPTEWLTIIQADNGSSFNAELFLPVVEGITVCVAMSPARTACPDRVIPCP